MVQVAEEVLRRGNNAGAGRGRVPPHDLSAEESLLGAMLLHRDAIAAATEVCSAEAFYKPAHGHIYDAMCALYAKGEPVDPVTVADELRRSDLLDAVGGPSVIVALQASTPATGNAARYARIVEELAVLRRLIGVAGEIAELGYDVPDDVDAAVDRAESLVFEVAQRRVADTMAPLRDLLGQTLDRLETLFDRGEEITGVPTGFLDLDHQLAGLQPSNLVIVGARPGCGKTSFALNVAAHAAIHARRPVVFFSLEMSRIEISSRLLCAEARVDSSRMRNGRLLESDWPKISQAIGKLGEAPIFVDDNPMVTVMDIRGKSRRLKSKLGDLGLVVVDYIQLMSGRSKAENRQVEVSEISRGLKILARELECPVIALSQLSRNLESRADKRPVLADLRESGCMPADTRILRADTGQEITLGELVLSQEQPLVWSLDEDWRLVPRRLVKAFPSGVKPLFRLRLASGYEVDASANHRFRTVEGWRRLDQLQVGQFLAVPRRTPLPGQTQIAADRVQGWDQDELVLLPHLLGDGSMGPKRVKYATADPANKKANPNADLVPWPVATQIKRAAAARGVTHRQLADALGERYCGSYLLGNENRPRRFSRDRLRRIGEFVGEAETVARATSDVLWEEIVEISSLGDRPTFDATVEGTHNFVANGVVAHNSLEQDADVVLFLYRDELYDHDSQDRGIAEVHVSKHRSGPTGLTKLAFLDQYTRFANMAKV